MHKAAKTTDPKGGKEKKSKAAKKLKAFWDTKKDAPKRCKAVTAFLGTQHWIEGGELKVDSIEYATAEEVQKFFVANYAQVYSVFDDSFTVYEGNSKRGEWQSVFKSKT